MAAPAMTSPIGNVTKRGGFTLIEVLLAASLLCIGLVAVLGAYQGCATALAAARESLLATVRMENQLDHLRQRGLQDVGSDASGEEDGLRSRVERVASVVDGDPDLETVRITAWRREGEAKASLTTVALRARGNRK